ncbi:MAG: STAS domain-containing protein [Chloroflexi bacterium]|nr:STAS domain-containing protein [Chloroflexota bacterium]
MSDALDETLEQNPEALRHEVRQLREQLQRLEAVISELAVPVVPLLEGVIVLPLVGSLDTRRAQQVIESLLTGIAEQQADVAIIDITGVPIVDTQVASSLGQAIRAASLLGARVVITGIGARIAQTLVALDIDFSSVTTCANLRDGIEAALALNGMHIARG